MLSIKNGELACRVHPESAMSIAVLIMSQIFDEFGVDAELTSGREGDHVPGSMHWKGLAYDITVRSYIIEANLLEMTKRVIERLGDDYDVILTGKTFHVEFDPKTSLGKIGE